MSDPIGKVSEELVEASARARELVRNVDARLFTIRPHPGSWSAAECIAHLTVTTDQFLPLLRDALSKAPRLGEKPQRPRMGFLAAFLRWMMEPPIRKRFRTSAPFVPKSVRAKAEALAEFRVKQTLLLELLEEAREVDVNATLLISPFDGRVKYNAYAAFRIIAAHQRRHLWQAEKALENLRRADVSTASG